MGLRWPDSNRESVLTEMPVASEASARVTLRWVRMARRRGPTASGMVLKSGVMPSVCHNGKFPC